MLFKKWVKESEMEINGIMSEEIKRCKGLVPEGKEEKLIQSYLTYRIVRVTWIFILVTLLINVGGIFLGILIK